MSQSAIEETGIEIADCCGCDLAFDVAELFFCDRCGKGYCPDCWEDHRCGNLERETEVVCDALKREGVRVK